LSLSQSQLTPSEIQTPLSPPKIDGITTTDLVIPLVIQTGNASVQTTSELLSQTQMVVNEVFSKGLLVSTSLSPNEVQAREGMGTCVTDPQNETQACSEELSTEHNPPNDRSSRVKTDMQVLLRKASVTGQRLGT
jgi:hypothetical protein